MDTKTAKSAPQSPEEWEVFLDNIRARLYPVFILNVLVTVNLILRAMKLLPDEWYWADVELLRRDRFLSWPINWLIRPIATIRRRFSIVIKRCIKWMGK